MIFNPNFWQRPIYDFQGIRDLMLQMQAGTEFGKCRILEANKRQRSIPGRVCEQPKKYKLLEGRSCGSFCHRSSRQTQSLQCRSSASDGALGPSAEPKYCVVLECDGILMDVHNDGHREAFNRAFDVSSALLSQ